MHKFRYFGWPAVSAVAVLLFMLAACTPAVTPFPTQTPMPPTATLVPLTPTLTVTLTPTEPIPPILTPDAYQVEHWQEYQTELAKVLLSGYSPALGFAPDLYKHALCEWDILGRSGQEVYVWVLCAIQSGGSGSLPALIHLDADGSVQNVEVPEINNSTWDSQIRRMFPADVREKIALYYSSPSPYMGRREVLRLHLHDRQTHPDEPPLVVLSASPTP